MPRHADISIRCLPMPYARYLRYYFSDNERSAANAWGHADAAFRYADCRYDTLILRRSLVRAARNKVQANTIQRIRLSFRLISYMGLRLRHASFSPPYGHRLSPDADITPAPLLLPTYAFRCLSSLPPRCSSADTPCYTLSPPSHTIDRAFALQQRHYLPPLRHVAMLPVTATVIYAPYVAFHGMPLLLRDDVNTIIMPCR